MFTGISNPPQPRRCSVGLRTHPSAGMPFVQRGHPQFTCLGKCGRQFASADGSPSRARNFCCAAPSEISIEISGLVTGAHTLDLAEQLGGTPIPQSYDASGLRQRSSRCNDPCKLNTAGIVSSVPRATMPRAATATGRCNDSWRINPARTVSGGWCAIRSDQTSRRRWRSRPRPCRDRGLPAAGGNRAGGYRRTQHDRRNG